ncbi:hypothetical protein F511_16040 [Dorcoceras hygrometricum]|uniref:Uncharacterized protein n=1 Tax=Dorcoceras hygrometricum TaxID=472368 RepID=A0A2Z7B7J8_9LAMI|nr:hypothetical protein F511_16040 [Dorcoceras hygrometricum]
MRQQVARTSGNNRPAIIARPAASIAQTATTTCSSGWPPCFRSCGQRAHMAANASIQRSISSREASPSVRPPCKKEAPSVGQQQRNPHGHAPPFAPPCAAASCRTCSDHRDEEFSSVLNPSSLLVQIDGGRLNPVVDLIGVRVDAQLANLWRVDLECTIVYVRCDHAPPFAPPCAAASCRTCSDHRDEEFSSVLNPSSLLVQIDGGRLNPVVDLIGVRVDAQLANLWRVGS